MTDLAGRKPILCLDFDGVCHSYTSGWKGADVIPDPPVPGLFEFLANVGQEFELNIFSSRSNQKGGRDAMRAWFVRHYIKWHIAQFPGDTRTIAVNQAEAMIDSVWKFPTVKPPAFVGIDDRVITFTGQWPSMVELKNFKPWNQLGVSGEALCGIANVPTSISADTRPIAKTAEPSEVRHLPDQEWSGLSKESQEKVSKWFELATKYLQAILDEPLKQETQAETSKFKQHTLATAMFLNELYAIMVDPLAEGVISVGEMCQTLLHVAREQREQLHKMHYAPAIFGSAPPDPRTTSGRAVWIPENPAKLADVDAAKTANAVMALSPIFPNGSVSAEDLDAVAEEQKAREATTGARPPKSVPSYVGPTQLLAIVKEIESRPIPFTFGEVVLAAAEILGERMADLVTEAEAENAGVVRQVIDNAAEETGAQGTAIAAALITMRMSQKMGWMK